VVGGLLVAVLRKHVLRRLLVVGVIGVVLAQDVAWVGVDLVLQFEVIIRVAIVVLVDELLHRWR
jgi:hypothetical protein